MNSRKIIFTALLLLVFGAGAATPGQPLVVATASIFEDMAKNISGGLVEVRTIVPIGGDPHTYEPTPADAQLVAKADLILKNGLTFEGWIDGLIANAGARAQVVTITQGIQAIESAQYQNASDPHAWMDASLGLIYIENIKNALQTLDPANAEVYEFNYQIYRQQLADLDRYILETIQLIPQQQRVLITSHDAFRYYGRRYGIEVEALLGTSTDAEAQTSDIMRLSRTIRERGVPAIFIETSVNPKLLKQIAKDNRVRIGGQLYSDSIGGKNSPAPTYLDMLKYNTDTILAALLPNDDDTEQTAGEAGSGNPYLVIGLIGLVLLGGFLLVARRLNG
jgi:ABC-type Zn uptake system ZnuABC Zn-binding protein ZnuA